MLKTFVHVVDAINEKVGRIVAYALVPLTLVVAYEVFMRRIFNASHHLGL